MEAQEPAEYQVKAAFLYNFTRFVEWPPEAFPKPNDPIMICILGENPFGSALEQITRGKLVSDRSIRVKEVGSGQEGRACQVLFISSSERKEIRAILGELRGASVLTVGDAQRSAEEGCIIEFLLENNKVRFEINTTAADHARLKISSKLLNLAKAVKQ